MIALIICVIIVLLIMLAILLVTDQYRTERAALELENWENQQQPTGRRSARIAVVDFPDTVTEEVVTEEVVEYSRGYGFDVPVIEVVEETIVEEVFEDDYGTMPDVVTGEYGTYDDDDDTY